MATKNIVPRADSEGQLGTTSKFWSAGYIDNFNIGNSAAANLIFTPEAGDTITFAAGANGSLTITTVDTAAAAANIGFVVDGAFDVDAAGAVTIDGSAITIGGDTDVVVDIDASTLDIDASGATSIDSGGALNITTTGLASDISIVSAHVAGVALHVDANTNVGSIVDIDAGILDIDSDGATTINAASTVSVIGATSATFGDDTKTTVYDGSGNLTIDSILLDVNAAGAITVDSSSGISIDGAIDSNLTVTGSGQDLALSIAGGGAQVLTIDSAGTGTNAISINASAGGTTIVSATTTDIDGTVITLDASTSIELEGTTNVTGAMKATGPITGTNYKTIWVDAGAMVPTVTAGAQAGTEELATNDVMVDYFAFDTSTDEKVQFKCVMPEQWDLGTLKAKFYWKTSNTDTGDVAWFIQAVAHEDSGALDTAFGTAVSVVTADDVGLGTDNDLHITAATTAMTVAGSSVAEELVMFQIYRDVSADNYNADAHLLGVNIQYAEKAVAMVAW